MAAIAGSSNNQMVTKDRKCFSKECSLTLNIPDFSANKNRTDLFECKKSFHELGVGPEKDRFWAVSVRPFYRGLPDGQTRGYKRDYISATVDLHCESGVNIHGSYKISLVKNNATEVPIEYQFWAPFMRIKGGYSSWISHSLVEHDKLSKSGVLEDGCLRVRVDIRYSEVGATDNLAMEYVRELLFTGVNSDLVVMSSDGEEFKVHKFQVGLQSTILKEMISKMPTREGTQKLEIDFNADITWAILKFLYGFPDWMPPAPALESLLTAAAKYDIMFLKIECVQKLRAEISIERAASLLKLVHDHSVDTLKRSVLEFIAGDIEEFNIVGGFEELASEKELIRDIKDACGERKSKKLIVAV